MAHRNHEVGANERVDLTELHRLGLVDVTSRFQDRKQCLSVAFYLRTLVGIDRVLDRQRMQPELLSHGGELLLGGLVETYPCQSVSFTAGLVSLLEGGGFRRPTAVYVDGVVHYHVAYDTPISRHASGFKGTSLTLTRTQFPAIVCNAGNAKPLTHAEFANLCNAQQPLTAHS